MLVPDKPDPPFAREADTARLRHKRAVVSSERLNILARTQVAARHPCYVDNRSPVQPPARSAKS